MKDAITEILNDKKEIDILKKRANNKREAYKKRAVSYFSAKEAKDYQYLAPQGCIVFKFPPEEAIKVVEGELGSYLELDPKMNLPKNIEIINGVAIDIFNCKHKMNAAGLREQERYALVYMTHEQHADFRQVQAQGFKEGGWNDKPGIDASFEAENEMTKRFTENPKEKKK